MTKRLAGRLCNVPDVIWLVLIILVGLALRLAGLGEESLWFDEAFSWLVAKQPAWIILTKPLTPIMPPLYHSLLSFWMRLGESEAFLRSFSLLCGVLTIPVMYFLGRQLFSSAIGLVSALLTAVLPFQIYFSQEARPYALVILLSALLLWAFVSAWKGTGYRRWVVFGLLAGLSLHAHYFVIFSLAVFHGFVLLNHSRSRDQLRGLLISDLAAILVAAPRLPLAWTQTRQVTTDFWLASPTPVQPIKTLDFLLFGHTTPLWLVPVALFLTLSILVLVTWQVFRLRGQARQWLHLLLALLLVPMLLALLVSWTIGPVYLDRSFSLVTPAYILLLSWGLVHSPRRSPLPFLYGGLVIVALISLGNHYFAPDPAKPPFREVGTVLSESRQERDVILNLHDSSYLSLRYYVPDVETYLLNNDPDTWVPSYTWEWAGQRVSSLDKVLDGGLRLWLVIMPARMSDRQQEMMATVETRFPLEHEWHWSSSEPVTLRLYRIANTDRTE